MEHYLYELLASNIEDLMDNNTFLGNPHFFYEFVPIQMNISGTEVDISTFQFMQYFIHATKTIR